jgi:sugar phosphate permease
MNQTTQPPPPAGPPAMKPFIEDSALLRMVVPIGRSWLAIAAGYLGLFALLLVPAPLALIVGVLAILDLRRHPEKHGMGRAVFGVVAGLLGTLGLLWMSLR